MLLAASAVDVGWNFVTAAVKNLTFMASANCARVRQCQRM